MRALKKSLFIAVLFSLCTFAACKKQEAPSPAPAEPAQQAPAEPVQEVPVPNEPNAVAAAPQASPEIAPQAAETSAPLPILDYIPADAMFTLIFNPDVPLPNHTFFSMLKDNVLRDAGIEQFVMFMNRNYTTCAIGTFDSTARALDYIEQDRIKSNVKNIQTVGDGNRQWKVLEIQKSSYNKPFYRAYHVEGRSMFISFMPELDEKKLDAMLEKPDAPYQAIDFKQNKDIMMIGTLDNQILLMMPEILDQTGANTDSYKDFLKNQNITAAFLKNFPSTQFIHRSNDKGLFVELQLSLADPAEIAKLSSLTIPGPDLPTDFLMASAHINIDLGKLFDYIVEKSAHVDPSTTPAILQSAVKAMQSALDSKEMITIIHSILGHYGAASFALYNHDIHKDILFDIEGHDLTNKIKTGDNPAFDDETTPLTYFNAFFMGLITRATQTFPDTLIEPDKVTKITLTSLQSNDPLYALIAGSNNDRIAIGFSSDQVNQLMAKKPQISSRTDLIDLEFSDPVILGKAFQNNPTLNPPEKPITRISAGIGISDTGIKLHLEMRY